MDTWEQANAKELPIPVDAVKNELNKTEHRQVMNPPKAPYLLATPRSLFQVETRFVGSGSSTSPPIIGIAEHLQINS